MNFNLKHLVLSIIAVIFIMGSAAVADVAQLRGVGQDAHNSRVLDESKGAVTVDANAAIPSGHPTCPPHNLGSTCGPIFRSTCEPN